MQDSAKIEKDIEAWMNFGSSAGCSSHVVSRSERPSWRKSGPPLREHSRGFSLSVDVFSNEITPKSKKASRLFGGSSEAAACWDCGLRVADEPW